MKTEKEIREEIETLKNESINISEFLLSDITDNIKIINDVHERSKEISEIINILLWVLEEK